MYRLARQAVALVCCLALALGAAACAKKNPESSSSTPPASAVQVTDVQLGRTIGGDKRVVDEVETFKANDVIYASVVTSGTSPSAAIKVRWTFEDGQVIDESQQSITPTGGAATEFHISKPDGWPTGTYKAEVFLNGGLAQTKEFKVE